MQEKRLHMFFFRCTNTTNLVPREMFEHLAYWPLFHFPWDLANIDASKTCAISIFRPREINQISIQPKNFLVCSTLSPYLLLAKALEGIADSISTLIQCTLSLLESCMDPESFVSGGLNITTHFFLYFQFGEGRKDPRIKIPYILLNKSLARINKN